MIILLIGLVIIFTLIFFVSAIFAPKDSHKKTIQRESEKKIALCSQCMIGKQSYSLDKQSEYCPYISCQEDGKCIYYKPIK